MTTFIPHLTSAYYAQHKQTYSPQHIFPMRTVTSYELAYLINDDHCKLSLDHETYDLQGDTVIFRYPGQVNQSFMPYESIILTFDIEGDIDHPLLTNLSNTHQPSNRHLLRKLFEDIYTESLSNRAFTDLYHTAKITEILYTLSQESDSYYNLHNDPITNTHLLSLLKYIDTSLDRAFTIASMSRDLSLSERHIYNLFKTHMKTTPIKYINECRLNLSKKLLLNSNLPIHQIASKSGYDNPNYYITLFHKTFHITPAKYRKMTIDKNN